MRCPKCDSIIYKQEEFCWLCGWIKKIDYSSSSFIWSDSSQPGLQKEISNGIGMKFALIPSGSFLMGSPKNAFKFGDDALQHQVKISRPFYMQTTPVTQGQWKNVMENNPSHYNGTEVPQTESEYWWEYYHQIDRKGQNVDDLPVEMVSWHDVQEFIEKLNQMEIMGKYRMPTESEWEYSCRAGSSTVWHFGDNSICLGKYAWDTYMTQPVGQKKPNDWSLYDMHGNVWEWCSDWYGAYPTKSVTDPAGPSSGVFRVLRGGSWHCDAGIGGAATRLKQTPNVRSRFFGFRLVRTI